MSAFRTSSAGLLRLIADGTLVDRIAAHARMSGFGVVPSERRSWANSLTMLGHDLADAGLDQIEVLVEYKMPLTSKRADVVLAGQHPRTGDDSYVVVELKQWSSAASYEESESLFAVPGAIGPRLHPGLQVEGYCEYLNDFLGIASTLRTPMHGVAYLHNATDESVQDLFERPATDWSRVFTGQRRSDLLDYLRARLSGAGAGPADRFLSSAVRPSRHLLNHAAEVLRQRDLFTLIDEQRRAYELVLHAVARARESDSKSVVVIAGGPGSGKSVIALSLLGEVARQGYPVLHATGSRSFTQTLRRYAGRGSTRTQSLFKYFNQFVDASRNGIEVLVCDEAHRIRETSVNRFTRAAHRASGRPQIDELIAAARVPVFLLDEHQVVRPGETGTIDVITRHADTLGLKVALVSLHDQFRCGGSAEYEQWVLGLLGLDREPTTWRGDGNIDVRVVGSVEQMEAFLAERQEAGESARISAGFCWPWSDPRPDGALVPDVRVGSWVRPWNAKGERSTGGAPASAYWATDPAGFGHVGCVYTAQGFEYEWAGVIIGPDLVYRDGRLMTRQTESKDPAIRKNGTHGADADRLIRNTYKVLLTRGMRGTMIYSTDPETQDYLTDLVRPTRSVETTYRRISDGVYERRTAVLD